MSGSSSDHQQQEGDWGYQMSPKCRWPIVNTQDGFHLDLCVCVRSDAIVVVVAVACAHKECFFFFFFASFYKLIKISLSLAICLWYLIYTFYIWEKRSQQVNRVWGHVIAVREVILAPGNWTILTQRSEEDNVSTGRSRLLALCLTSCISPSNVNNNIKRGTILQWEAESYQMASHEQKTNSSNCTFLLGSLSPS